MKLIINNETLFPVLQTACSVVKKNSTLPILNNLLMKVSNSTISLVGTDSEVEMITRLEYNSEVSIETAVSAKKLLDICHSLPKEAKVQFSFEEKRVCINSGRSRFILATQPAEDFPIIEHVKDIFSFDIGQKKLKSLLESTKFAVSQEDARYYLTGLLLEISDGKIRAVATDGHRLALREELIDEGNANITESQGVIIPQKAVLVLVKLLDDSNEIVKIGITESYIRVEKEGLRFTSKLIEGNFPDYDRVIPEEIDSPIYANRELLKEVLSRVSILSGDKYQMVRLVLSKGTLKAVTRNQEHEEAEDEMEVSYDGQEIEVGFNGAYLLDILNVIKTSEIRLEVLDPNSSCLLLPVSEEQNCKYVIMPVRI